MPGLHRHALAVELPKTARPEPAPTGADPSSGEAAASTGRRTTAAPARVIRLAPSLVRMSIAARLALASTVSIFLWIMILSVSG